MHRNSRIAGIAIAFTLLVCIAAEWSTGQRGIDENLADIVGSKVKSKEKIAAKNVGKTRRIYAQAHPDNREAYENIRQTHRARLVSLAPLQKVYHERAVAAAKPFKRGGKALPPKTTEIVKEFVKTPWQDVNLVFKNPRHEAVPNLQVVVTVHRKSAKHRNALEDIIWPAPNGGRLVTDPQGLIKLEKVGPLPVSIDVAFAGEDEKDWQITRSQDASLSIDQGTGTPRDMPGKPIAIYSRHSPDMLQARETEVAPQTEPRHGIHLASFGEPAQRSNPSKGSIAPPKPTLSKPKLVYRDLIYPVAQTPTEIPVEHNVVNLEVQAEKNSKLTSEAAPGQIWTADANGKTLCKIPVASLGAGAIPIHVSLERPGGEAECLIEEYNRDPYALNNTVKCPPLTLVRLKNVNLAGGMGVLKNAEEVDQSLGGVKENVTSDSDRRVGMERLRYPSGIDVVMRPQVDPEKPMLCEQMVITGNKAGKVGGIGVGSTRAEVREALGDPEPPGAAGADDVYLDGGVQLRYSGDTISEMRICRPNLLLQNGTNAFVRRPRTKLYVKDFEGHPSTGITTKTELERYLSQIHSVEIAKSQEDADLVLTAKATFDDKKDNYIGSLPFQYYCEAKIAYELKGPSVKNPASRMAEGVSQADYGEEVGSDRDMIAVLFKSESDRRRLFLTRDKKTKADREKTIDGLFSVRNNMMTAARRCPIIASRQAYGKMVADIGRESDFSVRVTDIDYAAGTLTLNVGTAEGVHASTADSPSQFEISVLGEPLPYHEEGLSADYFTAVVTEEAEHSCTCQLRHRWRSVEKAKENDVEDPAPDAVRRIPDPRTGVVSARAWLPNPKLDATLIVDEDPQYSDFMASLVGPRPRKPNADYNSFQDYVSHKTILAFAFFEAPRAGYLTSGYPISGERTAAPAYDWQRAVRRELATNQRQPGAGRPTLFMPNAAAMAEIRRAREKGLRPSVPITSGTQPLAFKSKTPDQAQAEQRIQMKRNAAREQRLAGQQPDRNAAARSALEALADRNSDRGHGPGTTRQNNKETGGRRTGQSNTGLPGILGGNTGQPRTDTPSERKRQPRTDTAGGRTSQPKQGNSSGQPAPSPPKKSGEPPSDTRADILKALSERNASRTQSPPAKTPPSKPDAGKDKPKDDDKSKDKDKGKGKK